MWLCKTAPHSKSCQDVTELTRPVMRNWCPASKTHMWKSAHAMLLAYNTVCKNILEEMAMWEHIRCLNLQYFPQIDR